MILKYSGIETKSKREYRAVCEYVQREIMAAVAGLYGLGEDNRKYRLKQAALDREREAQKQADKQTPDGFSEP